MNSGSILRLRACMLICVSLLFSEVIQDVACVCRSYPEIKRKQNNTILTRSATDRDIERHYLRPILRYHYSSNPIFFYWVIAFKLLLNQSKLLINCLARGSSIQTRLTSLKVWTHHIYYCLIHIYYYNELMTSQLCLSWPNQSFINFISSHYTR